MTVGEAVWIALIVNLISGSDGKRRFSITAYDEPFNLAATVTIFSGGSAGVIRVKISWPLSKSPDAASNANRRSVRRDCQMDIAARTIW